MRLNLLLPAVLAVYAQEAVMIPTPDGGVVMLGGADDAAGRMKVRKLFITCRDDLGPADVPRLAGIQKQFAKAPKPKELVILECSAHAQFIFTTMQGDRAMREILRFLRH